MTSDYVCKFANTSNLADIEALLNGCNDQQRRYIPINRNVDYYKNIFLNDSKFVAVAYKDDRIYALQEFFLRKQILSWHLSMLIMLPQQTYFNCRTNSLSDLYNFCFSFAESKGYYQYDWSQRAGTNYENRFIRMKSQIPILQRYDHYDIGFVEKNSNSKYVAYDLMINNEPRPYDTLVRYGILKNEYRERINLSVDY
jgi:hypothetical protein